MMLCQGRQASASAADDRVARLIERVSQIELPNTTNPYGRDAEGSRRAGHLGLYLASFLARGCDILIIGEAVGYRGGRVTGVPLTSERVIASDSHFRRTFPELCESYEP